jgi:cytochrome c oxidase subunit III
MTTQTLEKSSTSFSMNPKKFALWLFIVSVIMIFASLTSAYIVRQSEGNWVQFELPAGFYFSSVLIVVSSVFMHLAYLSAKKDLFNRTQALLLLTALSGVVFMFLQWRGWSELVAQEIFFVGNPSGSFVYVISGLHAVHIVSAIIFVLVVVYQSRKQMVHSKSLNSIEMCLTFWHFLGGLWLYLFLFLVLNR